MPLCCWPNNILLSHLWLLWNTHGSRESKSRQGVSQTDVPHRCKKLYRSCLILPKFIKNFSKLAKPLTRLTRKDQEFVCRKNKSKHSESFNKNWLNILFLPILIQKPKQSSEPMPVVMESRQFFFKKKVQVLYRFAIRVVCLMFTNGIILLQNKNAWKSLTQKINLNIICWV